MFVNMGQKIDVLQKKQGQPIKKARDTPAEYPNLECKADTREFYENELVLVFPKNVRDWDYF